MFPSRPGFVFHEGEGFKVDSDEPAVAGVSLLRSGEIDTVWCVLGQGRAGAY